MPDRHRRHHRRSRRVAVRRSRRPGNHLPTLPRHAAAHRRDRRRGGCRQHPLDGRRRQRRPADPRRPVPAPGAHHHPLLRVHGLRGNDHRPGRERGMPLHLGKRPLPDPRVHLLGRGECRGDDPENRTPPADRRSDRRSLRRPIGASRRGIRIPDVRKQRERPLALARGGACRGTCRPHHRPRGRQREITGRKPLRGMEEDDRPYRAEKAAGTGARPQHPALRRRRPAVADTLGNRGRRGPQPRTPLKDAALRRPLLRRHHPLGERARLCRGRPAFPEIRIRKRLAPAARQPLPELPFPPFHSLFPPNKPNTP